MILNINSEQKALQVSLLWKVHESADVIMKKGLYGLSLMSKHSSCQSKICLFELVHLCTVKSKFLL